MIFALVWCFIPSLGCLRIHIPLRYNWPWTIIHQVFTDTAHPKPKTQTFVSSLLLKVIKSAMKAPLTSSVFLAGVCGPSDRTCGDSDTPQPSESPECGAGGLHILQASSTNKGSPHPPSQGAGTARRDYIWNASQREEDRVSFHVCVDGHKLH